MTPTADVDRPLRPSGGALFAGSMWAGVAHLLPQLYTVLISVAIARALGPSDMGRQSFIAFVSLSTITFCSSGISSALTRGISAALGDGSVRTARDLLRWGLPLEITAGLLGGAVVAAPALFGSTPSLAWILAGVVTALSVLVRVPASVLVGTHKWRDSAVVGLISGAVAVPVLIGVLAAGGGIAGVFAVEAGIAAINLAATTRLARRALPAGVAQRDERARRTATHFAAISTVSAVLTLVVFQRSEFFFLAHYSSDSEIAIYSIAFAAAAVLSALPDRLGAVAFSAFAALFGAGDLAAMRQGYALSRRVLVLAAMLLAALAAALGPAAISVVYGSTYDGAHAVLLVLLLGVPLTPLWSNGNWLLAGAGEARLPLLLSLGAAAVNVGLAVLFIPTLDAVGAAMANVGAQAAAGAAMAIAARRIGGHARWSSWMLLRGAVVAIGTGAGGWAATTIGGVLGLAAGTVAAVGTMVTLGVLLKPLETADSAILIDAVGGRLGGRLRRYLLLVTRPARA